MPTISLATWNVDTKLFDGEVAAGPVPVLFSEEAEASLEALKSSPLRAHQDIQRALKVFLMPELVELEEAMALVKKPR
jgi:hypothetical protein